MAPIRILYLEDHADDVELVRQALEGAGVDCEITHVDSGATLTSRLQTSAFDVVLIDYVLPRFDGLTAIEITRGLRPDVPVVLVTGAVAEDTAIEVARISADACVMKDRLSRLAPTLRRLMPAAFD